MIHGNALQALLAAISWGGGDFSGGIGVRHAGGRMSNALQVVLLAHAMSLAVLVGIALARSDAFPQGAPLAWGLGAGAIAGVSVCFFYIALSRGAMGTSAAVSGLLAAAIPAIVSSIADGLPSVRHLVGFLVAGLAIWLIAAGPEKANSGTMFLAIVSGAGFGIFFVALKFAGSAGVIWPMATARIGSLTVCGLLAVGLAAFRLEPTPVPVIPKVLFWAACTAVFDTGGNLFFLSATRAGRLDVAAVLASLYPATTILLAAWALKERPTRREAIGMLTAVGAVVLIAL